MPTVQNFKIGLFSVAFTRNNLKFPSFNIPLALETAVKTLLHLHRCNHIKNYYFTSAEQACDDGKGAVCRI